MSRIISIIQRTLDERRAGYERAGRRAPAPAALTRRARGEVVAREAVELGVRGGLPAGFQRDRPGGIMARAGFGAGVGAGEFFTGGRMLAGNRRHRLRGGRRFALSRSFTLGRSRAFTRRNRGAFRRAGSSTGRRARSARSALSTWSAGGSRCARSTWDGRRSGRRRGD